MQLHYLLVAAALCAHVYGEYIWDPAQINQLQATDQQMTYYQNHGNDFMCAMMSTDLGAGFQYGDSRNPPSAEARFGIIGAVPQWSTTLRSWKWFNVDPAVGACDFTNLGWSPAVWDLGQPSPDKWQCKRWKHRNIKSNDPPSQQRYDVGRTKYRITDAEYNHAFHPDGWVIFQPGTTPAVGARNLWGQNTINSRELPELRQQSDFLWNDWRTRRNTQDIRKVHSCGAMRVGDSITYSVLAKVLVGRGLGDVEDWPARNSFFSTATPEGLALLGTPAAHQCVLFLTQHKQWLGIKHIVSVRVFKGPSKIPPGYQSPIWFPQFIFEMRDTPANLVKPDPQPGQQRQRKPNPPGPPPFIPNQLYTPVQPGAPGPVNPQPGVPGPVNSQPDPPPNDEDEQPEHRREGSGFSYKVRHERDDKSFVRVHRFQKT